MPFERFQFKRDWTETSADSDRYFKTYEDSEQQVRADLQEQPDELKNALNGLMTALEAESAAELIGDSHEGTLDATIRAIHATEDDLQEQITNLAVGDAPAGVRSAKVDFSAAEWSSGKLTIPDTIHKRTSEMFGCMLWAAVDGEYRSDTWYTASTSVKYDPVTKEITLNADEPYVGYAVFFGV